MTHMQRPWGNEEAIRKVCLWLEWRDQVEERRETEEASKGQDFCVQGMHLGTCCPADNGCPWKRLTAHIQGGRAASSVEMNGKE